MPQLKILPEDSQMTELRIVLRAPRAPDREHTDLEVSVGVNHQPVMPCYGTSLPGIEVDYLNTIVEAAVMSWAYEGTRKDVQKALAAVKRLARMHRNAHEF